MVQVKDTGGADNVVLQLHELGTRVSKVKTTGLRIAALACLEACAEHTPIDSGNLLMNWHISASGVHDNYDSALKDKQALAALKFVKKDQPWSIPWNELRAQRGPLMAELMDRATDEAAEIDRDKNVSRVVVYNPAPYAAAVDAGSSTNVPQHMSEAGRAAGSVALAAYTYGTGQEDFKHLAGRATKIGKRQAGE